MRDIIFKELTAVRKKKRYLTLLERVDQGRFTYTATRRTIFRLKGTQTFKDEISANDWICDKMVDGSGIKRLSLLRVSDSNSGENSWQSKFAGLLYVMRDTSVMTISFLEIFTVEKSKHKHIEE